MLLPGDAIPSCCLSRVRWLSRLRVSSCQGTWLSPRSKATCCLPIPVPQSPPSQPFHGPGLWQSQGELGGSRVFPVFRLSSCSHHSHSLNPVGAAAPGSAGMSSGMWVGSGKKGAGSGRCLGQGKQRKGKKGGVQWTQRQHGARGSRAAAEPGDKVTAILPALGAINRDNWE